MNKSDPVSQLQERLSRVHAALASTSTFSIPTFQSFPVETTPGRLTVEFKDDRTAPEVQNLAASLVANVASVKDHLNAWCRSVGLPTTGDALIDSDLSVALVHDLWNRDKHGSLSRPRSGHRPCLHNLEQSLQIEPINGAGSSLEIRIDTLTGETRAYPGPNSRLSLVIDADIVGEDGKLLGKLLQVCTQAVDAWTVFLQKAGVPLQP